MGKKRSNVGAMEEDATMDMSPMIDMVFLLLIFFVVNATAITVKREQNVTMPTASESGEIKSANGYIVVNIWADQRPKDVSPDISMGDDDGKGLATEQDLHDYIKRKVEQFSKNNGMQPDEMRLYLRGDQKAVFKHARTIIGAAGANGISNIVFGVIPPKS